MLDIMNENEYLRPVNFAKFVMSMGNVSKKEFCRRTGLEYKKAKLFFKKKIGVDGEIANGLSKVLGLSPSTW